MSGFTNTRGDISSPTGSIIMYVNLTAPSGWLFCDGSYYNRVTYSNLFNVIGTTYGNTNNNDFKVPDLRGYFVRGASATNILTRTGLGSSTVTLAEANLPPHKHTITDPGHSHQMTARVDVYLGGGSSHVNSDLQQGTITTSTINASTGITINNTGSGTAFSILPSYYDVNYIIKT